MKIAVVGATGLVGQTMLRVLEEREFAEAQVVAVASVKSVGSVVLYRGLLLPVVSMKQAIASRPEIAIFSAGGNTSLQYANFFAENGTFVIDNSSAWRRYRQVPLVVPEVNAHTLSKEKKIIANPNCSTIQLVAALAPLHRKYGIKRLVLSTYQSVSGSGIAGIKQLEAEEAGATVTAPAYPHPIHRNIIPHGGTFEENGYTTEEDKLVFETRKILEAPNIGITATVVRVPVLGGHSISANIELDNKFDLAELRDLLHSTRGIVVTDDPRNNLYPMPLTAQHRDEVFVGRLRRDSSTLNGLNMWIVADNLRKGAATNAIQIAEHLIHQHFIV